MSTATAVNPWSVKTTSGEGGDFELPKGDTYPAALVALIDLGTHQVVFSGEAKETRKVFFVWELLSEFNSKGEPFRVAKDFTFSLNSKAKLRLFLEGWEGRKFADNEEVPIDRYLGQKCMVNVTEGTSASGKKFVDVASATKLYKGLQVADPTVQPFMFSVASLSSALDEVPIPEWVPYIYGRKIADEIKKSNEYQSLPGL